MIRRSVSALLSAVIFAVPGAAFTQTIDLPTSKQLIGQAPGHPQPTNSLPVTMAISPDHRYIVTVNVGYGTAESKYEQSLTVLDIATGSIKDFPDDRTMAKHSRQTLFSGLAFSRDGKHIYASMASMTSPTGGPRNAVGSGIVVYGFSRDQALGCDLAAAFRQKDSTGRR